MKERYLLYIDLLGFGEMTVRDPTKIARIYSIIDSLNAHRHDVFRTIVFSDTVLVYNYNDVVTEEDKDYLVWYLIEFAEDLHHRLTGQDIYFRGIVCCGDFEHYKLNNIQCFYGAALVNAYQTEKDIGCVGLFIDDHCNVHNKYFRTAPYAENLNFVYLNRHLEYLERATGGRYPIDSVNMFDEAPYAPYQIRYLKDIFWAMRNHPSPRARTKLLTNWDFHSARYPAMTEILTKNHFDILALTPNTDWTNEIKAMNESIKTF